MTHGINLRQTTETATNHDQRLRLGLDANRCWSSPRGARVRVTCLHGTVWASEAGNSQDILLARGQVWISSGRGKVVLQGLPKALVEINATSFEMWRWLRHKRAAMLSRSSILVNGLSRLLSSPKA